jgi:hypothetical protein
MKAMKSPELLLRLRYFLRVQPFHACRPTAAPAASHSISRLFASATDQVFDCDAKASRSHIQSGV